MDRSMIMVGKKVGQERLEESLGYVGMDLRSGPLSTPAFRRSAAAGHDRSALMMQPKPLVADEATSMLDASLRVNVLNVLKDLRQEHGITVVFITHDIGPACYLPDRVLVMEHGVMVEQGTTDEVIFNPQHEYTKRLLPDVPKLHEEIELHDLQEELQNAGDLA
jgi:peptide/nickel transport system ATP-binding protein